jgi:hypothetical protein
MQTIIPSQCIDNASQQQEVEHGQLPISTCPFHVAADVRTSPASSPAWSPNRIPTIPARHHRIDQVANQSFRLLHSWAALEKVSMAYTSEIHLSSELKGGPAAYLYPVVCQLLAHFVQKGIKSLKDVTAWYHCVYLNRWQDTKDTNPPPLSGGKCDISTISKKRL